MITWRRLVADLRNLSNGVLYYPILLAFAWFTYYSALKGSADSNLPVATPMLALFAGSLASIATECQDKVADRISIELGGIRARLKIRMLSLLIVNSSIVVIGLVVSFVEHKNLGASASRTIFTALTVTLITSTLGLLVASYIPHPLIALGATFALMSWGGADPDENWGLDKLLGMLGAESTEEWAKFAISFATPWMMAYLALVAYSHLGQRLGSLNGTLATISKKRPVRIPTWLFGKRSFARTVLLSALTNPLPLLALVFCLGLYGYGTINLAAKLATIAPATDFFALLPGLLFANVVPGLILAGTSQRRDAVDQESLLFQSQREANAAQTLQHMSFVAITLVGYILVLARTMNVGANEPIVIRSILLALVLSPGFATVGVILNRLIRLPLLATLVSYLLTLPEIFLARWVPESRPYLPSSLFSILVGGEGSYTHSVEMPSVVIAYILGACIMLLPLVAFLRRPRGA